MSTGEEVESTVDKPEINGLFEAFSLLRRCWLAPEIKSKPFKWTVEEKYKININGLWANHVYPFVRIKSSNKRKISNSYGQTILFGWRKQTNISGKIKDNLWKEEQ